MLPPNQPRVIDLSTRKKIWVYGAPFVGKSYFANHFPSPIFLNTDGNINSFTAPYVLIKNEYKGQIRTKMAWDIFVETVTELARGGHDYKTVVVDLVEDTYEHCRFWSYAKLGIKHESDNSFMAWDFVRNNFLNVYKQLTTLPLNVVLISHEDTTRDLTKRTGATTSVIAPAIQEKVANKLSGMVDIVARITKEDKGRFLNFKSDAYMFGGGRLNIPHSQIKCSYEDLDALYKAQGDNNENHPVCNKA